MRDSAVSTAGHFIEQSVQVYLVWHGERWVVDDTTFDGDGLFEVFDTGARREGCDCGDESACETARAAADQAWLPDGDELLGLMNEYRAQHPADTE